MPTNLKVSLSTLSAFAEDNLKAIYQTTNEKAFDDAFDSFFAQDVNITVNGRKTTRADYKQQLWNEKHNERSATVKFPGVVEVPADPKHPEKAGTVGLFLTATIKFAPPHGKSSQEHVTASYKLEIAQDKSVELTDHGDAPSDFDIRRVFVLDVVAEDDEDKMNKVTGDLGGVPGVSMGHFGQI